MPHAFATLIAVTGFGSVGMLLWSAAALLPILLHLWNRRRYQTTQWAAMEFLLAAVRKNARRMRFEQLLLLFVRAAILILLAMALADPIISQLPGVAPTSAGRAPRHTLFVMDSSYSMDYATAGQTAFERARELALQVVASGQQGDGFTLLQLAAPPRVIIGRPAFDQDDVIGELQRLELPHGQGDLASTLDAAQQLLSRVRTDFPRLRQTQVVLLTDLDHNTWAGLEGERVRARLRDLSALATVRLIDVGSDSRDNVAVTSWQCELAVPTTTRAVPFRATVRNFGPQNHQGVHVEFVVDGQVVAEKSVDVPASGEVSVGFTHRFETPRQYRVGVHLGKDRLSLDNRRQVVVPVRDAVQVLCVAGEQDAARYVSLALNPKPAANSAIRARVIPDGALLEMEWSTLDCIFLCNVASLTEDEAAVIGQFVRQGGGLVLWMGDRVRPENYQLLLGPEGPAGRLLPARPTAVVSGDTWQLDPRDYEHPVTRPFRGFEQAGLVSVPIWKYMRLELEPDSAARTALWIGADPILVDERFGQGRVAIVGLPGAAAWRGAEPTDAAWSALALWPSFPPLVQELLTVVTAGRDAGRNVIVGEPIGSTLSRLAMPASGQVAQTVNAVSVTGPTGQQDRVPLVSDDGRTAWTYGATDWQGYYAARWDGSADDAQWFAVNVDTAESERKRISPELFPEWVQRQLERGSEATVALAGADGNRPLFRWFLAGVLALLLVESVLAHRQDRGAV